MATQVRMPTGDSAIDNGWSSSSGGFKFADVDDPVGAPNDDTDYIFKNGANANQLFTFSPFTIPLGSIITSVAVPYRPRRISTAVSINPRIRVFGVTYEGTIISVSSGYSNQSTVWTLNPATGAAWLLPDVNGTGTRPLQEFGVANTQTTAGEEARVTQCYLLVTFTPPPLVELAGMVGGFTDLAGGFV